MPEIDLFLVGIAATVLGLFVVVAMAIGSMMSQPKKTELVSRVKKLKKLPPKLAQEVGPGGKKGEVERKSLLASIDLRPMISKFASGEAYMERLERELAQADIKLRPSEFLIFRAVMVAWGACMVYAVTFLIGMPNIIIGLVSVVPLAFIHIPVLGFMKSGRVNKFSNQLAEFLILITNSLRAGQTFMQGCSVAAAESPEPIASEFKQVIKEVNLGMPEDEAMENLLIRVPSEDLKIVVSGYTIQRRVGGNLAEILEQTSATIRERIKIQGQINTLTTQGKLSGVIVALIPFVVGGAINFINPEYMGPMVNHWAGWILIGFGLLMQTLGAFAIWKIVSIEI